MLRHISDPGLCLNRTPSTNMINFGSKSTREFSSRNGKYDCLLQVHCQTERPLVKVGYNPSFFVHLMEREEQKNDAALQDLEGLTGIFWTVLGPIAKYQENIKAPTNEGFLKREIPSYHTESKVCIEKD